MNSKMSIQELLEARGAEEARLYSACFNLGRAAGKLVGAEQFSGVASSLGAGQAGKVRAAAMASAAADHRVEFRDKLLDVCRRFDEGKRQRQEALESFLDPEDVDTAELLQAAMASEEELTSLADLTLSLGNNDRVLLPLRVAKQRGMQALEAHIRDTRPGLNDVCSKLDDILELPDFDPDDIADKFESTAPGVPSREQLLRQIGP